MRRILFIMNAASFGVWALLITLCAIAAPWSRGVQAIDLVIDADMVQNIQSANATAQRFSSTDYVDLTCKVCVRLYCIAV